MKTLVLFMLATLAAVAANETSLLPPKPELPPPVPASPPARESARVLPLTDVIPDWQARWDLARALSYLHRYDESLAEFRKVLAERPDDHAVRQDYGQVLLWAGKPDDAFTELSRVPEAQLTPAAALALADTLVARHDFPAAEKLYRMRLERDRSDQLTRLKLAELLSWTHRYDESLALFRAILAALPDDQQVRRRYALVLLANGQSDVAAAELRRTLPN